MADTTNSPPAGEESFLRDLEEIATTPCDTGHEQLMIERLVRILFDITLDVHVDDCGNIYACKGDKRNTLVLSAHHDKTMGSHRGRTGARAYHRTAEGFDECECRQDKDIYTLPALAISNGRMSGKLDNALGVALAIDCLRHADNLTLALTAGEEQGMKGAMYSLATLSQHPPRGIIVLDAMSPDKGSGVLLNDTEGLLPLERLCGVGHLVKDRKTENALSASIKDYAARTFVPLAVSEYTGTDLKVYSRKMRSPSVALGIPVYAMHEHIEDCSLADVKALRAFLPGYLREHPARQSAQQASPL